MPPRPRPPDGYAPQAGGDKLGAPGEVEPGPDGDFGRAAAGTAGRSRGPPPRPRPPGAGRGGWPPTRSPVRQGGRCARPRRARPPRRDGRWRRRWPSPTPPPPGSPARRTGRGALGLDHHVADVAGVAPRPVEQAAVEDDATADARRDEHREEVGHARGRPDHPSPRAIALASLSTNVGRPVASANLARRGKSRQAGRWRGETVSPPAVIGPPQPTPHDHWLLPPPSGRPPAGREERLRIGPRQGRRLRRDPPRPPRHESRCELRPPDVERQDHLHAAQCHTPSVRL